VSEPKQNEKDTQLWGSLTGQRGPVSMGDTAAIIEDWLQIGGLIQKNKNIKKRGS
jgi:hypothetical protein